MTKHQPKVLAHRLPRRWRSLPPALPAAVWLFLAVMPLHTLAEPAPTVRQFVVFSDFHLDGSTTTNTAFPARKTDSNLRLVTQAMEDARNRCPNPLFILNLGDNVRHRAPDNTSVDPVQIETRLQTLFRTHFPGVPVFAVPGNNDYGRDTQPHSEQSPAFLAGFSNLWYRPWLPAGTTFCSNGCYLATLPGLNHFQLLGLNSSYLEPGARDGGEVVRWATNALAQAARQSNTVWLACHIPPGQNAWRFIRAPFWDVTWQAGLLQYLATHHQLVQAMFCGHTHKDEFRLIGNENNPVLFVHIAPSISRCYDNNPAYQIFDVETNSGVLLDCQTYYLPLAAEGNHACWQFEYSFTNEYAEPDYSLTSLTDLSHRLGRNNKFADNYSVRDPKGRNDITPLIHIPVDQ